MLDQKDDPTFPTDSWGFKSLTHTLDAEASKPEQERSDLSAQQQKQY